MIPARRDGEAPRSRSRGGRILLFVVWALALTNAVVTVLLLQRYGEVETRSEAQDRRMAEIMELQIHMDARLRRLEERPSIESNPTIDFRPVRPDR